MATERCRSRLTPVTGFHGCGARLFARSALGRVLVSSDRRESGRTADIRRAGPKAGAGVSRRGRIRVDVESDLCPVRGNRVLETQRAEELPCACPRSESGRWNELLRAHEQVDLAGEVEFPIAVAVRTGEAEECARRQRNTVTCGDGRNSVLSLNSNRVAASRAADNGRAATARPRGRAGVVHAPRRVRLSVKPPRISCRFLGFRFGDRRCRVGGGGLARGPAQFPLVFLSCRFLRVSSRFRLACR